MLKTGIILICSFGYMSLLFAIAYYGDKRADAGRSIVANPYIYALSLAVYCTAWTFYGSVGRAAVTGPGFLPVYLGPTLTAALGWLVLRKMIRISKVYRITTIADFVSSRYGKSSTLGGVVAIIAVLGVVPYISLQLKAISTSFLLIQQYPDLSMSVDFADIGFVEDTAFYVSWALAIFAILFGTRHLEATERHEGLVAAIAFESLVKLVAFIAVGLFVTFGVYHGFGDLFSKAAQQPNIRQLFTFETGAGSYTGWTMHIFLSMMAVIFLPRQFQVTVVENVDETHLNKAMWLFPLYMLVINIFVLPITFGGMMQFGLDTVDADTFVLSLPMAHGRQALALLVYIGGLSAATGMVIVETVALSTMICNDLVMPILLRLPFGSLAQESDLSRLLLTIRRGSIILVLMLGYIYFHFVAEFYTLVSIGLISFTAVAQFAPSIIGGMFWKGGTRSGALWGLIAGFSIWLYCLVLPSLVQAGFLSPNLVATGPFGIEMLKPSLLFDLRLGMQGSDPIAQAVFWSMLINSGTYVGVSLFTRPSAIEHSQAALFVDVYKFSSQPGDSSFWRGTATIMDLRALLIKILGEERADEELAAYARTRDMNWEQSIEADAGLINFAEKLLAGVIGSASARVMVASVVKEEPLGIDEVMGILDETRQVIAYSQELEKATAELQAANERLKELDSLKDEFISTVTHELRTPLTAVRSLAEIIYESPDLGADRRKEFAAIIIKESERLSRLVRQVLDLQKMESGIMQWQIGAVDFQAVARQALGSVKQLFSEKKIQVQLNLPDKVPLVNGDTDRLIQVMVNLLSNAVKFCEPETGHITIEVVVQPRQIRVNVIDNGIGLSPAEQEVIFDKFHQIHHSSRGRPAGSGLGLTITRQIVEFHKGQIWVISEPGQGATFSFTLPRVEPDDNL